MPLQIRRGTELQRQAMTVPLASGELLYVTDDQRLYIGNGTTLGGVQITGYTNEDAQDAAAALFSNGSHTGISFSYNDAAASLSATVDLSSFEGTISASAFKGSLVADDSTILVDGISGRIVGPVFANVTGNVTGNLTGNVTGNVSGNITGVVTGTAGSSLIGNVVGNTAGYHTGDMTGSVFGENSTKLVDAVESKIVGPVETSSITVTEPFGGIVIRTDGSLLDPYDLFTVDASTNDADGPAAIFKRSRGTQSNTTLIQSGDSIFSQLFFGFDGSLYQTSAIVKVAASGTVTGGTVPGSFEVQTTNNSGSQVTAFKVDHTQKIYVANNSVAAGGGSGQVNLGGGVVGYLKVNIGGTDYGLPYYGLNP